MTIRIIQVKYDMNMKINIFASYKYNKYDRFIKYFGFKLNIDQI